MIRITTMFLCVLLAAAAFGRYRAEVSVRELHQDIEQLQTSQAEEQRSIQMLRAEIAYLENPERLAKVAAAKTDLRPSDSEQLVDAQEFAALLGDDADIPADEDHPVRQALADAPASVR
ncbi:MAG: hypothetical protein R3C58_11200 [Parvularculaceae bacterium]